MYIFKIYFPGYSLTTFPVRFLIKRITSSFGFQKLVRGMKQRTNHQKVKEGNLVFKIVSLILIHSGSY